MNIPSPSQYKKLLDSFLEQEILKGKEIVLKNIKDNKFIFKESLIKSELEPLVGSKVLGLSKLDLIYKENPSFYSLDFFVVPSNYFNEIKSFCDLLNNVKFNLNLTSKPEILTKKQLEDLSYSLTPNITNPILYYISSEIFKLVKDKEGIIIRTSYYLTNNNKIPLNNLFKSSKVENITFRNILNAVKTVYESIYTINSVNILKNFNINIEDLNIALIVQDIPKDVILKEGFMSIDNKFVTNVLSDKDTNYIDTKYFSHEYKSLYPKNDIILQISNKMNNESLIIQYVQTKCRYYFIQLDILPKTVSLKQIGDPYLDRKEYTSFGSTQNNCFNIGTAEGIYCSLEDIYSYEDKNLIVITSERKLLFNLKNNFKFFIEKKNIKGFVIIYEDDIYELSLLSKYLLNVPIVFVHKNHRFYRYSNNIEDIYNMLGSIYVGYHSSINLNKELK